MSVGVVIELKIRVKSFSIGFAIVLSIQNWPKPVDDLGCADKNLILYALDINLNQMTVAKR